MRFALLCPEIPGHLNPLTSLGAELQRRKHEVTLIGGRGAEPWAQRARLQFAPLGQESDLDQTVAQGWRELGALSGWASMRQTGRVLSLSGRMILRDLPTVLSKARFDGLLVDQVSPAALIPAAQHRVPTVITCDALACHYDPYAPPPPMLWRYRHGALGRVRNIVATRMIRLLYDRLAEAAVTGVSPLKLVFEFEHGLAQIAQQPAFFDFPRALLPDHFHYTGPWHDEDRDDQMGFPWERLDGRPLIYASMGTLQNNVGQVFRAIVDSVRGFDAQVVLSQGGSDLQLDLTLPENVILVRKAPQLRLLERAVLAITHAGLNTALECMARGVPMVCLPVTNDQPGVARRVEWLGLGEVIPVKRATAQRIRSSLERVLASEAFRWRAANYQQQLRSENGLSIAADIVERAFQERKRIRRASPN